MTAMMRAAVVREFGKPLSLEERPIPSIGPGEILVKVAACGVCHTDLHAANGDWPVRPTPPFIPGHEGVGTVVGVGAGGESAASRPGGIKPEMMRDSDGEPATNEDAIEDVSDLIASVTKRLSLLDSNVISN